MGDDAYSATGPAAPTSHESAKLEAADEAYQAAADLDRNDARFLRLTADVLEELRLLDAGGESASQGVSDAVVKARDRAYRHICERLCRISGRDVAFG